METEKLLALLAGKTPKLNEGVGAEGKNLTFNINENLQITFYVNDDGGLTITEEGEDELGFYQKTLFNAEPEADPEIFRA